METKKAARVALATIAVTSAMGLEGCKPIFKDGDITTVVNQTTCWQYPGGEKASRVEAPLGQQDNGLIAEGAQVTVRTQENDLFGPNSGFYTRVEVPLEYFVAKPINSTWGPVSEQGNLTEKPTGGKRFCWVNSGSLSPAKK